MWRNGQGRESGESHGFLHFRARRVTESLTRDNNYWQEPAKVANEQNAPESRDYRTGYGQTAYKRQLAYERLAICSY